MTDEQINEAIAEVCGWDLFPWEVIGEDGWNQWVRSPSGELCFYEGSIPDYCNEHEAMLKAENWLMKIDELSWDEYYCSFEKSLCCSTERQRAENFLKVLGKWKE